MPFDDDYDDSGDDTSSQSKKTGLNKVSSQKSMFDSMAKKPSKEDFEKRVKESQEKSTEYKSRTADLAIQFNKVLADKTLSQNKNLFQNELETDLLRNMIRLAQEINGDSNEREGEGSLSWITLLLKTCFNQRDRINKLEYTVFELEKKLNYELSKLYVDSSKKSG